MNLKDLNSCPNEFEVPVMVLSMGQIEIWNHFLNLKPLNRVKTNEFSIFLKCYQQIIHS